MSQAAYRWHGNMYCSGCVVDALIEDHEDQLDPMEAIYGRHEKQLDLAAAMLGVPRTDESFPQKVIDLPVDMCTSCLNWFQ